MSLEKFPFIKKLKEKTNSFVESLNFQKKNSKASLVQIELRLIYMSSSLIDKSLEESQKLLWVSRKGSLMQPLSTIKRKQSLDSFASLIKDSALDIELVAPINKNFIEFEEKKGDIIRTHPENRSNLFANEDILIVDRSPSTLLDINDNIYRKGKPIQYEEKDLDFYRKISIHLKITSKYERALKQLKELSLNKFIPPKMRGKIWPKLIPNKLKITKNLFKDLNKKLLTNPSDESIKKLISIPSILFISLVFVLVVDIHRTYPTVHAVTVDSNLGLQIKQAMELFNIYREDIGYVQGMVYLGLVFLLHMDLYHGFKYFCNLILGNDFLYCLYKFNDRKRNVYIKVFDILLKKYYPKVSDKLEKLEISSDIYLIEWFFTLFGRAFDIDVVSKLWDLMFIYGLEFVIFKFTLTLFSMMEYDIINCKNNDSLLEFIKSYTGLVEPNLLFRNFAKNKLKYEEFTHLLNEKFDDFYLEIYEKKNQTFNE